MLRNFDLYLRFRPIDIVRKEGIAIRQTLSSSNRIMILCRFFQTYSESITTFYQASIIEVNLIKRRTEKRNNIPQNNFYKKSIVKQRINEIYIYVVVQFCRQLYSLVRLYMTRNDDESFNECVVAQQIISPILVMVWSQMIVINNTSFRLLISYFKSNHIS